MPFEPIFIMGLHRSGTTILYKMLGETGQLNIVKAYHILNYDKLLYNHLNKKEKEAYKELETLFKSKKISNRKFDDIQINPDYPQEYVYILERKNYPNKLNEKSVKVLEELCKKIRFITNKNPIILKNPYDYDNFLFLKEKFPNAKFIFIHRDPIETINSNLKAWQTIYKEKNPYTELFSPKYKRIYQNKPILLFSKFLFLFPFPLGIFIIINRTKSGTDYFLKNIDNLDPNNYVNITYKSLCNNPNSTMEKILDFLNVESEVDFKKFIKPRKSEVPSAVKIVKNKIEKKLKQYYDYLEKLS